MLTNVMGIINLHEKEDLIQKLTDHRPLGAIPFAGRYRLIDFMLSNMVNSGITNVGVLTGNKPGPIMDHLRSGKEWDLARKRDGLFILPTTQSAHSVHQDTNDIVDFYAHLNFLQSSKQEHVLLAGTRIICNTHFQQMFAYHIEKNADVTILCKLDTLSNYADNNYSILESDTTGRVFDLALATHNTGENKVNLNVYLLKKQVLIDLISNCYAHGGANLLKDGLIRYLNKLNVFSYEYPFYTARISSVEAYFKHSMELLSPEIAQPLFLGTWPIYTKVKDEAPTKYTADAIVSNSMLANGCIIEGKVENSIFSRGVSVHKNASVKNCILMQGCVVQEGVNLENVICDKNVTISAGKTLIGDSVYPLVIAKNKII